MAATPVKVYCAKPANSSCRFCKVDFSTKKIATFKIYGRSSGPNTFLEQIKGVLGHEIPEGENYSNVSCRNCHTKIERLFKCLREVAEFRESFKENERNIMPSEIRMKRCSKSPHQSGVIQKKSINKLGGEAMNLAKRQLAPAPEIKTVSFSSADTDDREIVLPFQNVDVGNFASEAGATCKANDEFMLVEVRVR